MPPWWRSRPVRDGPLRDAFYWLAILFTFAPGTAAGGLVAEHFAIGYLASGVLFGSVIASPALGYVFLGLVAILGFWLVYILTCPLGASFGDLLSQPVDCRGMGSGRNRTSLGFLSVTVTDMTAMQKSQE
ncbi:hypothetical protein [Sagittula sp. S175]|uniref:hypothetical protein n=1 Tax=Sagittula sp. S175 TaxID=3415129 RepID=UPI003C7BADD2